MIVFMTPKTVTLKVGEKRVAHITKTREAIKDEIKVAEISPVLMETVMSLLESFNESMKQGEHPIDTLRIIPDTLREEVKKTKFITLKLSPEEKLMMFQPDELRIKLKINGKEAEEILRNPFILVKLNLQTKDVEIKPKCWIEKSWKPEEPEILRDAFDFYHEFYQDKTGTLHIKDSRGKEQVFNFTWEVK